MSDHSIKLEPGILYERSRLLIVSSLIKMEGGLSFTELLEATQLTKGNLGSHLQKLENEQLVKIKKRFVNKKPLTSIEITEKGRKALLDHLSTLQALIKNVKT